MLCFLESCIPYSEKTCLDLARRLCLHQGSVGRPFSSNYTSKGCHFYDKGQYANTAFYGTDGTEDQMKKALISPEKRPTGYDCKFKGMDICTQFSSTVYSFFICMNI